MENYHARQELVLDQETSNKIKEAKILVVGAGAGGNEVLKNLALMGFGNFTIVDFDPIEASNLSRTTLFSKEDIDKPKAEIAAKTLEKVCLHSCPNIHAINAKIQDIGKQVFLDNDIVVCCVDTNDARAYINDWCVLLQKPFFEMGFEKFVTQICFFPNETSQDACLREVIGFGEFSGKRQSCSKLKMSDDNLQHIPTIQVSSAFAGAFIATEIIMYLGGTSKLKNKIFQYSAEYHKCSVFETPQSEKCIIHRDVKPLITESKLTIQSTVKQLLDFCISSIGEECLLRLEDDFIFSMDCEGCGQEIAINKYKTNVYDKERWCKECYDTGRYEEIPISSKWNVIREINLVNKKHSPYLSKLLCDFAIKPNDLVRVDSLYELDKSYFVKIN